MSKQQAENWVIETDNEDEPDSNRFEEEAVQALRAAARDLASVGWKAHDLANEVAEAIAPGARAA